METWRSRQMPGQLGRSGVGENGFVVREPRDLREPAERRRHLLCDGHRIGVGRLRHEQHASAIAGARAEIAIVFGDLREELRLQAHRRGDALGVSGRNDERRREPDEQQEREPPARRSPYAATTAM